MVKNKNTEKHENNESKKARAWVFTNFNLEFDYSKIKYNYMVVGKEVCPTTGKLHHQGYVVFPSPRTLKSVGKEFGCYVKQARSNAEANTEYCKKGGEIVIEDGEMPMQGKRSDLVSAMADIKQGVNMKEIADKYPAQYCRYYKGFEKYQEMNAKVRNFMPKIIYIWGKSGTGKTEWALENYPDAGWVKYRNGFFNSKISRDVVVFDEFDKWNICPSEVLTLLDKSPYDANIKGGEINFTAHTIILIGNVHFKKWPFYDPGVDRRFDTIIKMEKRSGTEVSASNNE